MHLPLVDHLRLTFGHVACRHKAHTDQAIRQARLVFLLRNAQVIVLLAALGLSIGGALGWGPGVHLAAMAFVGLALAVHVVLTTSNLEETAQANRTAAARLWLVREEYRALLADLAAGVVPDDRAREQRDELMQQVHAIYDEAPPTSAAAYVGARKLVAAADAAAIPDEEIDRLLPESMRRSGMSEQT